MSYSTVVLLASLTPYGITGWASVNGYGRRLKQVGLNQSQSRLEILGAVVLGKKCGIQWCCRISLPSLGQF